MGLPGDSRKKAGRSGLLPATMCAVSASAASAVAQYTTPRSAGEVQNMQGKATAATAPRCCRRLLWPLPAACPGRPPRSRHPCSSHPGLRPARKHMGVVVTHCDPAGVVLQQPNQSRQDMRRMAGMCLVCCGMVGADHPAAARFGLPYIGHTYVNLGKYGLVSSMA